MKTKIYIAIASCVIVLTLMFVEPAGASATHDRHQHQNHQRATKRVRQRARAQRKASRRAVSYVCPMHTDIREKLPGTCPKCLMDLVSEPRNAKTSSGAKNKGGLSAETSTSGSIRGREE